jgi:hypothetical protein
MSTTPGHLISVLLAQLLLLANAPLVQSQADSGLRVRITTSASRQPIWVGTLISADQDSVKLVSAKDRQLVALPIARIVRAERSRGRRSNAGRGATIGAVVGGGTGLILGLLASGEGEEDSFYEVGADEVIVAMAFLAAAGAGIGALVGAVTPRDQWEPLTLPGQVKRESSAGTTLARFVIRF